MYTRAAWPLLDDRIASDRWAEVVVIWLEKAGTVLTDFSMVTH